MCGIYRTREEAAWAYSTFLVVFSGLATCSRAAALSCLFCCFAASPIAFSSSSSGLLPFSFFSVSGVPSLSAAAACFRLAAYSYKLMMRLAPDVTVGEDAVTGEAGRGEVLPCTCEVDSRSEGECAPCWLEVAVLFAMMTEVPLIGREKECARPVGGCVHVIISGSYGTPVSQ